MIQRWHLIAFLIGVLILTAGFAFCIHAKQSVLRHIRTELQKPENAKLLTPEVEQALAQGQLTTDFGTELPPSLMSQIICADLLFKFRYLWITLVFAGSFGLSYFFLRKL
jgi:hypothetical protein